MIRDARESDLAAIVDIYNASIPGRLSTADTEPVTVESRRAWLRDRDFSRYPIWVSEDAGSVVGWLGFNRFYGRPAYAATAEVSVYVAPAAQGRGVGDRLLAEAIRRAGGLGLSTFLAVVFAHNPVSLALFRKHGFVPWGRLPRVASLDGVERDVLILGRRVDGGDPAP
jgi:L-amino acid N-acyltransferase YncA